jgi:uncharacterized protein (TIGR02996 family)
MQLATGTPTIRMHCMTQTTDAEAGFLEDILDHPEDDVPRLIYADWLTERGDPRGDFIRVQCQLPRVPRSDPRHSALAAAAWDLLNAHGNDWRGDPPVGVMVWFERGLPHASAERRALSGRTWPWWQRLRPWLVTLRIEDCTDGALRRLVDAQLADPAELDVSRTAVTDAGLEALSRLSRLQRLSLASTRVTDAGVEWLSRLQKLRSLSLLHTAVTAAGLAPLRGLPHLATLAFPQAYVLAADREDLWQALRQRGIDP